MSKEIILNALDGIQDRYITEAAGKLGLLNGSASALNRRRESALSRFFGSGWGVAMICAVVSLSVLGGIVWAGQRPVAGPSDTTTESETVAETEVETEPEIVEGELDKSSDLVSTLVVYLNWERSVCRYPVGNITFSKMIDSVESGVQPLLVAFDPCDYYFVCGYYDFSSEYGDIFLGAPCEYTWVAYKNESDIQEYYNDMKCAVAFQINRALSITEIVPDERVVPDIQHFQIYKPSFENGVNVSSPVVFDEALIYWDYSSWHLNESRTLYCRKPGQYDAMTTTPCVNLDGNYYLSFYSYTIYSNGEQSEPNNFSSAFDQYYDVLTSMVEEDKYSTTGEDGSTSFYGTIRIDDFIDFINGIIK